MRNVSTSSCSFRCASFGDSVSSGKMDGVAERTAFERTQKRTVVPHMRLWEHADAALFLGAQPDRVQKRRHAGKDVRDRDRADHLHKVPKTPDGDGVRSDDQLVQKYSTPRHKIKIRRRFDIGDTEYMKPVSGGKIMLYALLACLLLYLILF